MKIRVPLGTLLLTLITMLYAASAMAVPIVYAVDSSTDSLYTLDLNTGDTTLIGALHPDSTRFVTPVAMAIRSDGTIFVNNNSPAGDNGLAIVDSTTGLATSLGGGSYIDQALAFDDSNYLYASASGKLARIDQITGTATILGVDLLPRLMGLDYNSADGYLYGITGNTSAMNLVKLDTSNGDLIDTISIGGTFSGSAPGTLMFDWEGNLWATTNGGTDNLFQIDTATGSTSNFLTVSAGFVPQGMDWVDTARVPEPSSLALLGLGMLGFLKLRSGKSRVS